ncbi:amidase, hydantoinase/carbamoylase family, partial [Ostertagia ostertagi]
MDQNQDSPNREEHLFDDQSYTLQQAGSGKRLANYFIDYIVFIVFLSLLSFVLEEIKPGITILIYGDDDGLNLRGRITGLILYAMFMGLEEAIFKGRNKIAQWMKEAGLSVVIDNTGNVRGSLHAKEKTAKTFVLGSHIDTVNNAGKFDGPLGVLMAIDLVSQVSGSGCEVPFNIEVVGFCDEEGCRFHTTYIGSRALTGSLDDDTLQAKDKKGISLLEAIREGGGDVNNLRKDALAKQDWLGYFEIHIEQGPVLFERHIPVGIVTGIAGQRRISITLHGEAGHAGTVPMDRRKDAMVCAAEFIIKAEELGKAYDGRMVVTTGKVDIVNPASNVIPGEVILSLD